MNGNELKVRVFGEVSHGAGGRRRRLEGLQACRNWKAELRARWNLGMDTGELRRARNIIGPSGLEKIKLFSKSNKPRLGEGSTPGPWHSGNGYIIRDKNNDPIANCRYTETQSMIFQEAQIANAALVAKAPLLIEATKVLERSISALEANGAPNCEAVKEARALLAKLEAK